jgi:hypothetical protein
VHELSHADRSRVSIAADSNGEKLLIGKHDAGGAGIAAMNAVESTD